eukprot:1375-Heterococcus_DN1.PRE.1
MLRCDCHDCPSTRTRVLLLPDLSLKIARHCPLKVLAVKHQLKTSRFKQASCSVAAHAATEADAHTLAAIISFTTIFVHRGIAISNEACASETQLTITHALVMACNTLISELCACLLESACRADDGSSAIARQIEDDLLCAALRLHTVWATIVATRVNVKVLRILNEDPNG